MALLSFAGVPKLSVVIKQVLVLLFASLSHMPALKKIYKFCFFALMPGSKHAQETKRASETDQMYLCFVFSELFASGFAFPSFWESVQASCCRVLAKPNRP